jgi:hypothetical protein
VDGPCFHNFRLLTSAATDRGAFKLMLRNGGRFKMNGSFTDNNYMNSSRSVCVICLMSLFLAFPASAKDKGNFEDEQQPHQPADQ